MKISLNWLKQYIDIPVSVDELSEILTALGLEVEGVDEVESIPGGLVGMIIGQVETCDRHPNADRLSLTTVNVGQAEHLQIVCGAPNVAAGQKVVVATIGAKLYPTDGEPFVIKKGKIRGEASEGMICAEDEIGIGSDHAGIMVLPETVAIGSKASDYFEVEQDVVFDIGLTPNRSDATSHIGVARDLAAYFVYHKISDGMVKVPSVDEFDASVTADTINVIIEDAVGCPRFSGVSLSGVQVKESPKWMQEKLKSIGVRPISNIVDITNYVLHEVGQPLHAYNQDKITGQTIRVKNLKEGTVFKSLDELDRTLSETDLMICDGDSNAMCIAGVFGGLNSGVKDDTTNIFLEAAHFNAKRLRKTSTRHLLRTDAAMRFEKGSDPNVTVYALKRAAQLMVEYGNATVASKIVDVYDTEIKPKQITVRYSEVNKVIGNDIDPAQVKDILTSLKMTLISTSDDGIVVAVPTNKADVVREIDIIEEILRIYGFNNVELDQNIKSAISYTDDKDQNKIRQIIAQFYSSNGFHEMMNLSLSESALYEAHYGLKDSDLVFIQNTSNIQLNIMRADSLIPILQTIRYNQNRQQTDLAFFEFGKSYKLKDKEIVEREFLATVQTGKSETQNWLSGNRESDYYGIKQRVEEVLIKLGITSYQTSPLEDDTRFHYGMKYHQGPRTMVVFGEVSAALSKAFDIQNPVYFAEFEFEILAQIAGKKKVVMEEISKYPSSKRDIAMILDNHITFSEVVAVAKKTDKKMIKDISLFDVYKNEEQIGANKKSYAVSFTFEDTQKTLKDKDVDKVFNKLIQNFEQVLQATVRK